MVCNVPATMLTFIVVLYIDTITYDRLHFSTTFPTFLFLLMIFNNPIMIPKLPKSEKKRISVFLNFRHFDALSVQLLDVVAGIITHSVQT